MTKKAKKDVKICEFYNTCATCGQIGLEAWEVTVNTKGKIVHNN